MNLLAQRNALFDALCPFVSAYKRTTDPGESDLYPEQPRHVTVTLGDCRKAARIIAELDRA